MSMQTLNVHIYLGQYSERNLIKVNCNVSRFNQVLTLFKLCQNMLRILIEWKSETTLKCSYVIHNMRNVIFCIPSQDFFQVWICNQLMIENDIAFDKYMK